MCNLEGVAPHDADFGILYKVALQNFIAFIAAANRRLELGFRVISVTVRMSCAPESEAVRRQLQSGSEPNTMYDLRVRTADSAASSAVAADLASALDSPQAASSMLGVPSRWWSRRPAPQSTPSRHLLHRLRHRRRRPAAAPSSRRC